ncbi:MAG: hypothetical protein N2171_08255 [Clostridia bacterium]|nr:hypothetical protein [Clostridia bacterium]
MCDKQPKCCTEGDSLFFIAVSSIIIGIIAAALFVMGYFPSIINTLIVAVLIAFVMLLFAVLLCTFRRFSHQSKHVFKHTKPFVAGILGTIASTSLAVSSFLVREARSFVVLVFLSATFFAFMCSYFYKLAVCLLREEKDME